MAFKFQAFPAKIDGKPSNHEEGQHALFLASATSTATSIGEGELECLPQTMQQPKQKHQQKQQHSGFTIFSAVSGTSFSIDYREK